MNIELSKDDRIKLSIFAWEIQEAEIYQEELAYNLWEQRDLFIS